MLSALVNKLCICQAMNGESRHNPDWYLSSLQTSNCNVVVVQQQQQPASALVFNVRRVGDHFYTMSIIMLFLSIKCGLVWLLCTIPAVALAASVSTNDIDYRNSPFTLPFCFRHVMTIGVGILNLPARRVGLLLHLTSLQYSAGWQQSSGSSYSLLFLHSNTLAIILTTTDFSSLLLCKLSAMESVQHRLLLARVKAAYIN